MRTIADILDMCRQHPDSIYIEIPFQEGPPELDGTFKRLQVKNPYWYGQFIGSLTEREVIGRGLEILEKELVPKGFTSTVDALIDKIKKEFHIES